MVKGLPNPRKDAKFFAHFIMLEIKNHLKVETRLLSSMGKVFPNELKGYELSKISALENEPISFQFAFRKIDKTEYIVPMYIKIMGNIGCEYIKQYRIDNAPVIKPIPDKSNGALGDLKPGLYPDLLLERSTNAPTVNDGRWCERFFEADEKNLLDSFEDTWQGVWFTVNEQKESLPSGEYKIHVYLMDAIANEPIAKETLTIEIIPSKLPKQDFLYTAWFHCDCLADIYGVQMFSDEHFEIIKGFLKSAAETGMNMVLLPAFTPPLDTSIGRERATAQLVGVKVTNGGYEFDFTLFKRFVNIAKECGITHFEHSHLFTQWGAEHAPKIMAEVNGENKRIFDWDTDAAADEYKNFLTAYFYALKRILLELEIEDKIMFHISDEPMVDHLENYSKGADTIKKIIPNATLFEALSHYGVYEKSSVDIPVVAITSKELKQFEASKKDFWVYFTGEHIADNLPNRLITSPYATHRIMGIMIYYSGAKGFLHWGFNYYYGELSHGICAPQIRADYYCGRPGSAYIVYPGFDRKPIPSIRMKVFYEGINDLLALKRLEALKGREFAIEFIKEFFGEMDFNCKAEESDILKFRELLNKKIAELHS